jgi:hypothetical protein
MNGVVTIVPTLELFFCTVDREYCVVYDSYWKQDLCFIEGIVGNKIVDDSRKENNSPHIGQVSPESCALKYLHIFGFILACFLVL